MARIKSGVSNDFLTIDSVSNAMRLTLYKTDGTPEKYIETYKGSSCTYRIVGNATTPQNLLTIENVTGSGTWVVIKGLFLATDSTAAITTVACQCDVSRTTAIPSSGTTQSKGSLDTSLTSNTGVTLRSASSGTDGVNGGSITATAASGYIYRAYILRMQTIVGQTQTGIVPLLPQVQEDIDSLILQENEALVVQITGTAASNAATNHYMVTCIWDEITPF